MWPFGKKAAWTVRDDIDRLQHLVKMQELRIDDLQERLSHFMARAAARQRKDSSEDTQREAGLDLTDPVSRMILRQRAEDRAKAKRSDVRGTTNEATSSATSDTPLGPLLPSLPTSR